MAIKGQTGSNTPTENKERKTFEKKLYVGVAECKVVGINMDKEQMVALGWNVQKDPVYIGTSKKNEDLVTISIVLKENSTGAFLTTKFIIIDKERSKSSKGTFQYLNNLGWETWAASEDQIKADFAKRPYRRAKEGESAFYNFMRKWLCLNGDDAEMEFNLNKLLRGNFRELHEVVKNFPDQKIVVMATVHEYEKDGKTFQVQQACNIDFLPAEIWGNSTLNYFKSPDMKRPNDIEWFTKNITKEKYGCQDHYSLNVFEVFNSATASSEPAQEGATNTGDPDGLPF